MPAGIEREEMEVQRVRQPGEGMPVGRAEGGERPLDGLPVQLPDVDIVYDVSRVVESDEGMLRDRVVDGNRDRDEHDSWENSWLQQRDIVPQAAPAADESPASHIGCG